MATTRSSADASDHPNVMEGPARPPARSPSRRRRIRQSRHRLVGRRPHRRQSTGQRAQLACPSRDLRRVEPGVGRRRRHRADLRRPHLRRRRHQRVRGPLSDPACRHAGGHGELTDSGRGSDPRNGARRWSRGCPVRPLPGRSRLIEVRPPRSTRSLARCRWDTAFASIDQSMPKALEAMTSVVAFPPPKQRPTA